MPSAQSVTDKQVKFSQFHVFGGISKDILAPSRTNGSTASVLIVKTSPDTDAGFSKLASMKKKRKGGGGKKRC